MQLFLLLLKMNIVLSFCYLLYRVFLQPLTFFNLNRIFLAASLLLSACSPFYPDTQKTYSVPVPSLLPSEWSLNVPAIQPATVDWVSIFSVIYWAGVSLMALLMVIRLISLLHRYTISPKKTYGHITIRTLDDRTSPFSFFRSIFINPALHSDTELALILQHEQVHSRQVHSVDILLGEIIRIFCWFNPFVWMIADAIRKNLEFVADRQVLETGTDPRHYQYSLLATTGHSTPGLPNHFNFSHLKTRIHMMNKQKSSKPHLIKYLLATATVTGVLLFTTSLSFAQQQQHKAVKVNTAKQHKLPVPANGKIIPANNLTNMRTQRINKIPSRPNEQVTTQPGDVAAKDNLSDGNSSATTPVLSSSDKPLILLDGQKITDLTTIAPDKIASVSVLKDAASIAGYGEEAKNGVILITSKQ